MTFYSPAIIENLQLYISPAGNKKSEYIVEKLDEILDEYDVYTMAETSKKRGVIRSNSYNIGKHGKLKVFWGFGKPNAVFRRLHHILRQVQIYHFLNKLNEDDIVINYHSLITAKVFFKAKQKRKFKLILELEEKYQDVVNCTSKQKYWEDKIIGEADAYILATEKLNKCISSLKKYVVCNGTYKVENQIRDRDVEKIHCVYAGTFDSSKGGAQAAIKACEFLDQRYHVHILGFGTQQQVDEVKQQISLMSEKTRCKITFDGLKKGKEYLEFLQMCSIGLCTQIPDAKFADTSFPSKILVYMANGLRVISGPVSVVKESEVGKLIYYYTKQDPKEIAKAISNINLDDEYDSRLSLKKLDLEFKEEFKNLINDFFEKN